MVLKRETEEFDKETVKEQLKREQTVPAVNHSHSVHHPCSSAKATYFERNLTEKEVVTVPEKSASMLSQWPVQLTLEPPTAPFFENADLLIAADCVPFATQIFTATF